MHVIPHIPLIDRSARWNFSQTEYLNNLSNNFALLESTYTYYPDNIDSFVYVNVKTFYLLHCNKISGKVRRRVIFILLLHLWLKEFTCCKAAPSWCFLNSNSSWVEFSKHRLGATFHFSKEQVSYFEHRCKSRIQLDLLLTLLTYFVTVFL